MNPDRTDKILQEIDGHIMEINILITMSVNEALKKAKESGHVFESDIRATYIELIFSTLRRFMDISHEMESQLVRQVKRESTNIDGIR